MRIALTGTPGTGKTTAAAKASLGLDVVHLNELIHEADLTKGADTDRETAIADLEAVRARLDDRDDLLIDSHLSHRLPVDRVIVLRCAPRVLEERLSERGEPPATVRENAESEALDVILADAVERHGLEAVYEIETTEQTPEAVAKRLEAVVAGDAEPRAGDVDYTDYL
jgi:adenylate kinase